MVVGKETGPAGIGGGLLLIGLLGLLKDKGLVLLFSLQVLVKEDCGADGDDIGCQRPLLTGGLLWGDGVGSGGGIGLLYCGHVVVVMGLLVLFVGVGGGVVGSEFVQIGFVVRVVVGSVGLGGFWTGLGVD